MKDALLIVFLIVVCVAIIPVSGLVIMRHRADADAFHREVINYQRDTINRCDKHDPK